MTAMAFLSCPLATARQVSIAPPADNNAHLYVTVLKYMESYCFSKRTSIAGLISGKLVILPFRLQVDTNPTYEMCFS